MWSCACEADADPDADPDVPDAEAEADPDADPEADPDPLAPITETVPGRSSPSSSLHAAAKLSSATHKIVKIFMCHEDLVIFITTPFKLLFTYLILLWPFQEVLAKDSLY